MDLRGHRLRGPGTGVGFGAYGEGRGGSFVALTVSNGRVDHWGTAFDASSASLNVRNVRTDHNEVGVSCSLGGCTVEDGVIRNSTVGAIHFNAELNLVRTLFRWNTVAGKVPGSFGQVNYRDSLFLDNRIGVQVYSQGNADPDQQPLQAQRHRRPRRTAATTSPSPETGSTRTVMASISPTTTSSARRASERPTPTRTLATASTHRARPISAEPGLAERQGLRRGGLQHGLTVARLELPPLVVPLDRLPVELRGAASVGAAWSKVAAQLASRANPSAEAELGSAL